MPGVLLSFAQAAKGISPKWSCVESRYFHSGTFYIKEKPHRFYRVGLVIVVENFSTKLYRIFFHVHLNCCQDQVFVADPLLRTINVNPYFFRLG